MNKKYVIDTNILLDDPNAIEVLSNGEENLIYIPEIVIYELEALKKTSKKSLAQKAIEGLDKYKDKIKLIPNKFYGNSLTPNDTRILFDIIESNLEPILVTNDKLLRVYASLYNIQSQPYINSQVLDQVSNGVSTEDNLRYNTFFFKEDLCYFYNGEKHLLSPIENIWTVTPNTQYQQMAMFLLLKNSLNIVALQSVAGMGKTYLTLAAAFYLTYQKKQYKKILVIRPTHELGKELGFLPGDLEEKMLPYARPILDLVEKLNDQRPISDLYTNDGRLNKKKLEVIPLNFLRGANISETFVIIDEVQNISRTELRTILTRCCAKVKVVLLGDINQIDNTHLNKNNNALTWALKLLQGYPNFGHLVLEGKSNRGPICETVLDAGL